MSTIESEAPALVDTHQFKTSFGSRVLSAMKILLLVAFFTWFGSLIGMKLVLGRRLPPPTNALVAAALTLSISGLFAWRRFASHIHTLRIGDGSIELESGLRAVRLDSRRVQGLIGAGGMQPVLHEMLVWNRTIIVVDGKAYALLLTKEQNLMCYFVLREACVHAWGLPFGGKLETPVAGPELSPEEYVESLASVKTHYFLLTQKTLFTGILIAIGSLLVLLVLIFQVGVGGRAFKGLMWLGVITLFGVVTVYRALRQMGELWKIYSVERRLRQAM